MTSEAGPSDKSQLIAKLRHLGRDDAHELGALLDDEDIPHSAREAIIALQNACMDAAATLESEQ